MLHPLLQELAAAGTDELPRALIERCMAAIPEIAPELLAAIERAAKVPVAGQAEINLVCYGVHILAAAREPRLQGPLLRLVRLPDRALDQLLGFDYVETLGPIMIGAFDGDAQALFDLLWDEAVVEFVRPAAFGAVAYLTWLGRIPAETTRAFLDRFDTEFQMRDANLGWDGGKPRSNCLGVKSSRHAWRRPTRTAGSITVGASWRCFAMGSPRPPRPRRMTTAVSSPRGIAI